MTKATTDVRIPCIIMETVPAASHTCRFENILSGSTCTYPDSIRVFQHCKGCGKRRELDIRTPILDSEE